MLPPSFSATDTLLEAQYQSLVARYYTAQADFHNSRQECTRLIRVIHAKQEVIAELLPYYPHPLTQALQDKINLT